MTDFLFDTGKGAKFSPCGKYRYYLYRIWDSTKPLAMCIGLNPSRANAEKNDNTINILIRVLGQLGYGGFYMTNLFAWISSHPEDLLSCPDPIGDNDAVLSEVRQKTRDVIFCWGNFTQAQQRALQVISMFPGAYCFGFNANGTPYHPMALSYKKMLSNPILQSFIA